MKNEEKAYLYWLHHVPGVGDKGIKRLMENFGSAKEVYHAPQKCLSRVLKSKEATGLLQSKERWEVEGAYQRLQEKNIRLLCREDTEYPQRLRKMEQAPYILYIIGKLPEENRPAVAIIGARECSGYGEMVAKAFATHLAQAGVNIISGMARGIDGISQEAAVMSGGKTFAVLGCGADICYPASNRNLYEAIPKEGGIISPYVPGQRPQKNLFPYRNQIVAGLSDALLVVEARQKSGTLITVDRALEQGKDVYAVPGRITDRLSDGCNLLIRQGAGIALSPEDMLAELKMLNHRKEKKIEKSDESEKGLLHHLDFLPKSVDEIWESIQREDSEMTLSRLMFELIQLCMQGKAKQIGGNYFVRVR